MKISLGSMSFIHHSKFHNSRILWGIYKVKSSELCGIIVIIKMVIVTTTPTIYWEPQILANEILGCIKWVLTLQWKKLNGSSKTLSNLSKVMGLASSRARIWTQVYHSLESMLTPLCHAGICACRMCVCVYTCAWAQA